MGQSIGVEIQDEEGRPIERFGDSQIVLELIEQDVRHTTCLRFIDQYGDTTINQLQLPVLLAEVEEVGKRLPPESRLRLRGFAQFLVRAQEVHHYVKFIGD
jgi:hypothetical protein